MRESVCSETRIWMRRSSPIVVGCLLLLLLLLPLPLFLDSDLRPSAFFILLAADELSDLLVREDGDADNDFSDDGNDWEMKVSAFPAEERQTPNKSS